MMSSTIPGGRPAPRWNRWLSLVAVTLFVLGAGCAEERPVINRVQAEALAKSFFVGPDLASPDDDPEFYMRTTVVDAAAGAGSDGLFTSSDAQPTTRVRWEISEELLLARLTYELIDNTDGKGIHRVADGQVVAAFEIDKHFDIIKDYNPTTGEELNVIVENDSDRPWYAREYMRVDWSKNLITTAYELDTMAQLGIYYGVEWEPVAYYVSDPSHPDHPVWDPKRGYFDVTGKVWALPETYEDAWWGTTPVCWLFGYFPTTSCNPSEITLRQAFLRVGDSDYEPAHWDGGKMDLVGLFTWDRHGYDRRYGVVDDKWRRFATRWNIWEQSHVDPPVLCNTAETTPYGADPHRDDDGDGTEDECAAVGRGSRCDDALGECTVPYRDRSVRTIAWHVNASHPADLFPSSAQALAAWNDAVRVAVVAARLTECRRTHEVDCEAQMGWPVPWSDDYVPPKGEGSLAEVPDVFVLCHNPVDPAAGDDVALCGPAGTAPRLGDLRYNFITVIPEPQTTSPWGIMMDAEDVLTGEKIAGSVNVWAAVGDRAAASVTDMVLLLSGLIDADSYIAGEDISNWIEHNQWQTGNELPGGAMDPIEIAARRAAFDPQVLTPYLAGMTEKAGIHPKARHQARARALVDSGKLGPGNAALSERMRRLQGSEIEARLASPEMMQLAGYDPTGPVSAEAIHRASPFGRNNPAARRDFDRSRRMANVRRHACRYEAPEPDNLLGLAKLAQQLFPAPDPSDAAAVTAFRQQIYDWARQSFNLGVMAHEMGHSMGLRHNFAASWDALNYEPQYWQLRTHNGEITADCAEGTTDGSSCVGPRWRDPISAEEIDGNLMRYATSSVMDYPGDNNQDMILPGKYDRAAVRLTYAGTVDVWADPNVSVDGSGPGQAEAWALTAFALNPGLFGVYWFPTPDQDYRFIHYSRWQDEFHVIEDCQPSSDADAVLGAKCRGRAIDPVDYRDMKDWIDWPEYSDYAWAFTPKAVDPTGRVRRGYLFSSDEYADAGNVPSFTGDAGADAYEQVRFLEGLYENRYILDSFRRERVTFNSQDVVWRIQARYLDNIQQIAKTFAFGALLDGDPAQPSAEFLEDGYYGPLAMAGTVALDMIARQLTRPEPGYYCPIEICAYTTAYGTEEELYAADAAALPEVWLYDYQVLLGDGRYLHNDFDYAQGYWWGDYQTQVGAYYEKVWATYYLAEAYDYFISNAKEDFTDSRYKNVNFATVFPEQVRRLYNALLTNDYDSYAPWVVPPPAGDDTPVASLVYPAWFDAADTGTVPGNGLRADPNYGWNAQIYAMVWGSIFFPTNWSWEFVHEARITATPAETPDWPDSEIIAFHDPVSAITYRARSSGTETVLGYTRQRSAGARMLEWANKLVTVAYLVELDGNGVPVLGAYGMPTLVLDGNGQPQLDPQNPGADAALQAYVDNIDQMRQLVATFGLPLGDDDLPQP